MDNTSIITQVANPKEEEILSSCQEKGEVFRGVYVTGCFCFDRESLRLCADAFMISVTNPYAIKANEYFVNYIKILYNII